MAAHVKDTTHDDPEEKTTSPIVVADTTAPKQAQSLQEGLAAAEKYEGDPMECPCIKNMKEGTYNLINPDFGK